ncbi:hypothetical protein AB0B15_12050 [Streptomyces sp. NPDC045456]
MTLHRGAGAQAAVDAAVVEHVLPQDAIETLIRAFTDRVPPRSA